MWQCLLPSIRPYWDSYRFHRSYEAYVYQQDFLHVYILRQWEALHEANLVSFAWVQILLEVLSFLVLNRITGGKRVRRNGSLIVATWLVTQLSCKNKAITSGGQRS